ncbi:probable serine/threonine-protein kinase drkD [Halichondria panicea]|uniref:probable serine/threonine-protein kinase drkD n=1 Tax=Halichondria panicea TaxID=6063 RepID=UPI00312B5669
MANRITAPELEQFIVATVELTGRVIGAGAYGSVEEVEIPGATVAAKKLHQQLVNLGSPQQVEKWVNDFVEECKLMSQLRHPHIVQFLGVCYLPGAQLPVLLMEKLQTSLDNLLETSPNIPIDLKVHLLTGTGRGVVYLHSRTPPIAHRDLSAKNILVDNGLNAKIADLGVSRIVNIQPGRLAASMTQMPGTGVYMPPEAAQEEGVTRYNTAIDIFSFGVVSLFTLTQTFPKSLKPANYRDPATRRLVARSEIERREHYIIPMKTALGETHPLVQLTLACLEYDQEDRPSAAVVLRGLEEVGTTLPQNCTQTKLELIQQVAVKDEEIQQVAERVANEKQAQIDANKVLHLEEIEQRDVGINQLQREIFEISSRLNAKDTQNTQLQASIDRLQADKREQVRGLAELTTLQQEQLEVQRREIDRLSISVRSLQIQPQEDTPQGSGQREATTNKTTQPIKIVDSSTGNALLPHKSTTPQPTVPTAITFNWTTCKDIPRKIDVYGQPVTINGKVYMRGENNGTSTVLVYTPDQDSWDDLPSPPVYRFTIATLRGRLLVVGGQDKSINKNTNTILTFDESSGQWVQSLPRMPKALAEPAVVEYQNHLIVIGGRDSNIARIADVNILNTSNKWITAEPLPRTDDYSTCLIGDTLYRVGQVAKEVFRAHVPSLISRASSGVWESVASVPFYHSSPIAIGNTLLTVGGRDCEGVYGASTTSSIHLYDPTKDQWTQCGDLPEKMYDCNCIELSGKLCVLGGWRGIFIFSSVYTSIPSITH